MTTHAAEQGFVVTHTLCGRDLNPSCGSYGSHSSRPQLSGMPTCKACRRAKARLARVEQGQHPTSNGMWRMTS
jgi:hypothetical protein